MQNYVITIARGYGSGGKAIGMKLAQRLGIECYENRILALASEFSGYEEGELRDFDEKVKGNVVINKLARVASEIGVVPMTKEFRANQQIFDIQKEIILTLGYTESCVIVGKGADYILRDFNNVISVYIEAPRDYRRKRVMERQNVNEEKADMLIASTDKYRAAFYNFYTKGRNWTDPTNYDMTLNSGRMGEEGCIRLICEYLRMKQEEPA